MRHLSRFLAAAALAPLPLLSCGDATAPADTGSVRALIADDPGSDVASAAVTAEPFRFAHHKSFGADYYHGTLTARVEVQISTDGVRFVGLGPAASVSVPLQDTERSAEAASSAGVPVGTYTHLRLVFQEAAAAIEPGSAIGGLEIDSEIVVPVGEATAFAVEAELSVPLAVRSGKEATLAVELNSQRWLTEDNIVAGRVPAAAVGSAMSASAGSASFSAWERSLPLPLGSLTQI